ncbi:D-alanyl-D-alanine carboxypeptidase family protein [Frondihabitans cladoniiphilus]|uniref:Peptidase S11 D-alanyl-D-alanine carboxypeptidase A N-terminal domain-containing protein n=1 Tax=Frondihabitans cladoniiphilus TaxID=715785 RepID=A0ABP8W8T6_9MICO
MSRTRALRPRRAARRTGWIALLALVVAVGVYLPATLLAPLPSTAAVVTSFAAPTESKLDLTFPTYGGSAVEAVGFENSLQTSGDTSPRSIASISKIVTALVVLDAKPLNGGDGPTITFSAADTALYSTYLAQDGEVAAMPTGGQLTEKQVMQVALIKSANNYAATLAFWAFGSNQGYVTAATKWLKAHGLDHTSLAEPTGLNPANQSTASDLVKLGKLAVADPDIASIVSTTSITLPYAGTIQNSNKLLGIDGVVGIKTGTLDQAGACLLFAVKEQIDGQDVTVVGAMLGGKDHPSLDVDVQKLLAGVKAGFHTVHAVAKGATYGSYSTKWGATAKLVTTKAVDKLVYGDVSVKARITTEKVHQAKAGEDVGSLTVSIGGTSEKVPLELASDLPGPDAWWRITNPSVTL